MFEIVSGERIQIRVKRELRTGLNSGVYCYEG